MFDKARIVNIPEGITATAWPKVRTSCDAMGFTFDDWQDDLGMLILAKRADGRYAANVGANTISICRQAGKTYLLGGLVFALCRHQPGLIVVWTAHQLATARETFTSMLALSDLPGVAPYMARPNRGSGREEIRFRNGSRILFKARERGGGLGFSKVGVLILDEAQRLTDKGMADLAPTTNVVGSRLVIMTGTPPRPTDYGEVFRRKRKAALAGELRNGLYVEFSADWDADPKDPAQRAKANPSYPYRTDDDAIDALISSLTLSNFRREGLGIWDRTEREPPTINQDTWKALRVETAPAGTPSYGVKFTADGQNVALAGAMKPAAGPVHVEGLDYQPLTRGTAWLADWLAARAGQAAQIVIDGRSGSGMLAAQLRERGVRGKVVVLPTTEEAITAHSMMLDAILQGQLSHYGQPGLDDNVAHAGKRFIGNRGGWGWAPLDDTPDVAILDACTLAHWAAKTSRRHPGRTQQISY